MKFPKYCLWRNRTRHLLLISVHVSGSARAMNFTGSGRRNREEGMEMEDCSGQEALLPHDPRITSSFPLLQKGQCRPVASSTCRQVLTAPMVLRNPCSIPKLCQLTSATMWEVIPNKKATNFSVPCQISRLQGQALGLFYKNPITMFNKQDFHSWDLTIKTSEAGTL